MKGKVIGYREWDIDRGAEGLELHAAGVGAYKWTPGRNEAKCTEGHDRASDTLFWGLTPRKSGAWHERLHEPPGPDCGCGLYARYEPQEPSDECVAGAMLAWGRIEAHHDGFRAQYAEPILLTLPDEVAEKNPYAAELLRECAARYDCWVVTPEKLVEAAESLGRVLPESERPDPPAPSPEPDPLNSLRHHPYISIPKGIFSAPASLLWTPEDDATEEPDGPRYLTS